MTSDPPRSSEPGATRTLARRRLGSIGLALGPPLGLAAWLALPGEYTDAAGATVALGAEARCVAGLLAWMATWWLTEAVALPATALLPLVLLPLGGTAVRDAAAPYAEPIIFLFLGGFLLALAMQRWGLDQRIALLTVRLVGTRPAALVGGVMLATAGLSACVSNTATTAMMLPIGLGVLELYRRRSRAVSAEALADLERALLLGMAYAASIGGLATIIGSPPTGIVVQYAAEHLDREIGFARWLLVGGPLTVVLLPFTWWLLTRVLHRVPDEPLEGGRAYLTGELRRLGPMGRGERATAAVFALAVLGWVARPLLARAVPGLSDAGIAVGAGALLFAIPLGGGRRALDWETASRAPFGVLLLFGGGLSLARGIEASGVADFLGAQARGLEGLSPWALTAVVTLGTIFLTELTSNTAAAATLVPVLGALAPALGVDALTLVVPAAVAASCAFMLPVATPPNAIVFGSGRLSLPEMTRAGLWLNLVAALVISVAMHAVLLPSLL